jgi:hypothetical protein
MQFVSPEVIELFLASTRHISQHFLWRLILAITSPRLFCLTICPPEPWSSSDGLKVLYIKSYFESRMENLSESTATAILLTLKMDILALPEETRWMVYRVSIIYVSPTSRHKWKEKRNQPRIGHLDSCLPPGVECDVPHISLHLTKGKSDLVVFLVGDGRIGRELDEIMRCDRHGVLDKVVSR